MNTSTLATTAQMTNYSPPYLAIAGERRSGHGRDSRAVVNPSTGEVLGQAPLATDADLADALAATREGFAEWSALTAYDRAGTLHRAADWMREHVDEGARRVALELGKVVAEARSEVALAASMLDWNADEALRIYGRTIPGRRPGLRLEARVQPVGPVYGVSSWNAPINTPMRKVGGALAAGCSIILKLSDQVPASGLFVFEAFEAVGLPTGTLQMVTGRGAHVSDTIVPDPAIRLVTLTGSVDLGRRLASQAAQNLTPQTMELGGHAPAIIHHGIDAVTVAKSAARAKFRNVGQVCTAPTRFFVHTAIVEEFTAEFVAETNRMVVGDPFAAGTQIGPMQNEKHLADTEALVADATARGGVVACGGHRIGDEGYFYAPTVLTELPQDAAVNTEEPFGPIALITKYTDLEDAVVQANSLNVGLSAYGFTDSASALEYLASTIEAGNIILNNWASSYPESPFGGVKNSGYGREGGQEGLSEFLHTVFVSREYTL